MPWKMPFSKQKVKEGSAVVLKEATPAGGAYAGFFSLQAGTVLTSTCIFGVALITFFYNLSAPNDSYEPSEYTTQYVLVYSYVSLTFIGTGIVSTFAFKKNPKWLLVGAIIVTCSSAYWFTMSLLSFFPSLTLYKYLCIMDRCPPTHWIFEVPWRDSIERNKSLNDHGPDREGSSDNPFAPNGTTGSINSDNPSSPGTEQTTTDETTTDETTLKIDLNVGDTFPPNSTGTLADNCDQTASISNEFLLKQLHNFNGIEKMKKNRPSNPKDEDDDDTHLDNTLYDLREFKETPRNHLETESLSTEPVKETMTEPEEKTKFANSTDSVTQATTTARRESESSTSQLSTGNVPVENNHNEYPELTEVPEELQKKRDKQWKIGLFMSSLEIVYSSDMFGGNLAMSIMSFIVFTAFLVYGLVCMFYMQKQQKELQREREMEDDERVSDERSYVSKMSLRTHPSKKSQRSQ